MTSAEEMTPEIALRQLVEGNARYSQDRLLHPNRSKEARICAASGQNPFAIIMGCSDSRVSPEIIFDQGIGDLFVVRVAGNVVGPIELNSIEYSALYLKSSVIMVLGHESCGAIQAVINGQIQDIETVASLIMPSLEYARLQKGSLVENTVKKNVLRMTHELKKSPVLHNLIKTNKIAVVGGYYNFQTGAVQLLTE
ncbi:MAG: carbonic anhydrase [Rhabdochlamydiaceae bacterium]